MWWMRPSGTPPTMVLTVALCLMVTAFVELSDFDHGVGNRRFHLTLEITDAIILIVLAAVLLGRFRSDGSRRNLMVFAGVVVLAAKNGVFAASAMFGDELPAGDAPVIWGTAVSGVLGAGLLAAAGIVPDRRIENSAGRVAGTLLLGCGAVVVFRLLASTFGDLPFAFPAAAADADRVTSLTVFSGHPTKIGIDLVTAACYAVAAVSFARHSRRGRDHFIGWMSIGCTVAAGAFLYYALIPSRFTELIYGGEILWMGAILSFAYGAIKEISNLEAALVRSAVRSERKRVARDLHDGVVQELAYISSQARWLLGRVQGSPHEQAVRRIGDAVARALDESRGAIAALNRELDEPLHLAVGHAVADVADRVGAHVDLQLDPTATTDSDWRDALIRIAREAVGNAVRHGGAREVRVVLEGTPPVLTIVDDGSGFDPDAPRSSQSFGLQSMRERAESLGGRFELRSAPGGGTMVQVSVGARLAS